MSYVAPVLSLTSHHKSGIIIGISGCSSSGKTTLARLLSSLFSDSFILHQDDFYKVESEIPRHGSGMLDWDCPDAIDIPQMVDAMKYIRDRGELPPNLLSKEDQNSTGVVPVRQFCIEQERLRINTWLAALRSSVPSGRDSPRICFLDGFLLYTPLFNPLLGHLLDARLFLLSTRSTVISRRLARPGYVTIEGFWQDPPGYAEKVVWPNYEAAHSWMFVDGDVQGGRLDTRTLEENDIRVQADKGPDVDMETTLHWAVVQVMSVVQAFLEKQYTLSSTPTRKPGTSQLH